MQTMARKLDRYIFGDVDFVPLLNAGGYDWLEAIDIIEERPRLAPALLLAEIQRHSHLFLDKGYVGEFLPRFARETSHSYKENVAAFRSNLLDAIAELIPVVLRDKFGHLDGAYADVEMLLNIYARVCDGIPSFARASLEKSHGSVTGADFGDRRGAVTRFAARVADIVGPFDVPVHPTVVIKAAAAVVANYIEQVNAGVIPMSPDRAAGIERTAQNIERRYRASLPPGAAQRIDCDPLRIAARELVALTSGNIYSIDAEQRFITDCAPPSADTRERYPRLADAMDEFSAWSETARAKYGEELDEVVASIEANRGAFEPFLEESMSEFKSWLLNRAIADYDSNWVSAYPHVDLWVSENVQSAGLDEVVVAIFAYKGVERTREIAAELLSSALSPRQMSVGM